MIARRPTRLRTARAAPLLLAPLALAVAPCACSPPPATAVSADGSPDATSKEGRAASVPGGIFRDATAEVGLDFVHFNGMTGKHYMAEMAGGGGALIDFDNDGDLDLWLRQGSLLGPESTMAEASFAPDRPDDLRDHLYRNDLQVGPGGERTLRLTNVTDAMGVVVSDYSMGVAVGDYDDDGLTDLYLTNLGPDRLLHNVGGGRFEEVTEGSGLGEHRWSIPAVFADFDRDGRLDLYVGTYVDFSIGNHHPCFRPSSAEDYCGPLSYKPQTDRLFHNLGGGRFEDVSARAGLAVTRSNALGVLAHDIDEDGWIDLYVANDGQENNLWLNQGDGTFRDDALLRGVAVNAGGEREASMGVSLGDFDRDRDPDLFLTHLANETNTLYVNDGNCLFHDATMSAGLATPSKAYTGFGTSWIDYDNDGWLDILTVNGEVKIIESLEQAGDPFPLHQKNQLFHNLGDGRFEEVSDRAGDSFYHSEVSRGAIFGDLDNDGDTDVVVLNNSGPAVVLLNEVGHLRHWLGLILRDRYGRPPQDARAELLGRDGPPLVRWAGTDGSYIAANDPRVLFGLGDDPRVEGVRVRWPSGSVESFRIDAVDTYVQLSEGDGEPANED